MGQAQPWTPCAPSSRARRRRLRSSSRQTAGRAAKAAACGCGCAPTPSTIPWWPRSRRARARPSQHHRACLQQGLRFLGCRARAAAALPHGPIAAGAAMAVRQWLSSEGSRGLTCIEKPVSHATGEVLGPAGVSSWVATARCLAGNYSLCCSCGELTCNAPTPSLDTALRAAMQHRAVCERSMHPASSACMVWT